MKSSASEPVIIKNSYLNLEQLRHSFCKLLSWEIRLWNGFDYDYYINIRYKQVYF